MGEFMKLSLDKDVEQKPKPRECGKVFYAYGDCSDIIAENRAREAENEKRLARNRARKAWYNKSALNVLATTSAERKARKAEAPTPKKKSFKDLSDFEILAIMRKWGCAV